jgi:hypothetical protein
MSGGEIIAIFAGIIAAIGIAYRIATLLEKLSQPVYPDVQDDPRLIEAMGDAANAAALAPCGLSRSASQAKPPAAIAINNEGD